MDEDDLEFDITDMSTITIDTYSDMIGDISFNTMDNTVSIHNGTDWIDLNSISIENIVFENTMPDLVELNRMCEEYPGLEKAYENFRAIYKMVEQDWLGKQKERNK